MFWNKKKIQRSNVAYLESIFARDDKLKSEGWTPWIAEQPFRHSVVETIRTMSDEVNLCHPHLLQPWFNVTELWWRPVNNIIDITPKYLN